MNEALYPNTLGRFDEVHRSDGRYFNDHCLFRGRGGVWHFFGIVGPVGKSCYDEGSEVSFAHATSRDLRTWEAHEDVMAVTGAGVDGGHVFAPHVIERDGLHYMFYTGIDERRCQRICLATSRDLFDWRRSGASPVIVPSLSWARWPGHEGEPADAGGNCRDCHVMQLPDGRYAAYWVAEMNRRFGSNVTCVAASVSDDLVHWQEVGPIFTLKAWSPPPTRAVESPCVVYKDEAWWLFFKHGWSTHYIRGGDPFDFTDRQAVPLGYCHASEVFEWNGVWHVTHCSGDPAEPRYHKSNRSRGLFLGELDWPAGAYPRFKHLIQQDAR